MKTPEKWKLLRIFIGEGDFQDGRPLYEKIVSKARSLNMAGATVMRGIMGYGAASRIHTAKILRLSEDLPIVIEIIDVQEKMEEILPFLDDVVKEGLIILEDVDVIRYRHNNQ